RLVAMNAAFADQLLGDACGYAARGFRENALGLREELDSRDDFGLGYILGPAAAFAYQLNRIRAVRGIADGQRARDSVGFLRLKTREAALHGGGNRRAARRLCAEEFYRLFFDPAKGDHFAKRPGDFF